MYKGTSKNPSKDQIKRYFKQMENFILELKNISVGYQKRHSTNELLSNLNIHIPKGNLVCLLGINGAGKSTLMKTIAGLLMPLKGQIWINRQTINKNFKQTSRLLSIVLSHNERIENTTVFNYLSLGRYPYTSWFGTLNSTDKQIIYYALEQTNLVHYRTKLLNELSDGEFQRVVIAKTIVQDTPLVLLDEPTAHLDLPTRIEIISLLRQLAKENNKAILFSTHELNTAKQFADKIWLINPHKSIIECNTNDENLDHHLNEVFHLDKINKHMIRKP